MARLTALLPGQRRQKREDRALALLSGLVGGLILARAVDDDALSDRLLHVTATALQELARS